MKLNIQHEGGQYKVSPPFLTNEHGQSLLTKLNLQLAAGEMPVIHAEFVIIGSLDTMLETDESILKVDGHLFYDDGGRKQRVRSLVLEDGSTLNLTQS